MMPARYRSCTRKPRYRAAAPAQYAPGVISAVPGQGRSRSSAAGVRLLGAVRFVTDRGETVDLPSVSQRRLLGALALAAGATLRPEYLSDLLDVSAGALRTTVSRLRSRLGDTVICTDAVGYRITSAVDTVTFTQLLLESSELPDPLVAIDDALALWDGEALDEFRHEPWAEAEASRLDELRCVAVEDRAELLIGRGRAGEAVAALEAHVAAHPLRDRARGLHIQALASEGRQADALRAYQDYRSVLAEETGTEPSALVRSIERRVAAGSAGDANDDDSSDIDLTVEPAATSRPRSTVPLPGVLAQGAHLIGRRRELTWLESELVQTRAGSLRIVLLSGEAGIGKTTLLASLARDSQRSRRRDRSLRALRRRGRGPVAAVPRCGRCCSSTTPRRTSCARIASASVASWLVWPPISSIACGLPHRRAATTPPSATSSSNRWPTSCAGSRPAAH